MGDSHEYIQKQVWGEQIFTRQHNMRLDLVRTKLTEADTSSDAVAAQIRVVCVASPLQTCLMTLTTLLTVMTLLALTGEQMAVVWRLTMSSR